MRSTSSTWRVVFDTLSSVNTLFSFFSRTETRKPETKFLFSFSGLLLSSEPCGAAVCSDEPGYRGSFRTRQHPHDGIMTFLSDELVVSVHNSAES